MAQKQLEQVALSMQDHLADNNQQLLSELQEMPFLTISIFESLL